jgi:hypothetical protein
MSAPKTGKSQIPRLTSNLSGVASGGGLEVVGAGLVVLLVSGVVVMSPR